ncbi:MlaC/ttg2D family ABC transporter substrate-binding protein [Wenzhouxiangella marina]|uniref:Toluene tolerance n=1 Tax=Wenzhouxiangella marina TaxID=1579979 RepID=A0A0K0XXA5_9GAMM|nr:ABC transporter substrate-binding protein [Wenzhouxiangella marina]AKS42310.1 Toluene tolerance [Wenzhouxiangella marina]MBB6085917.1 phospholipid transport system substrate-binding protein [Wenzhouxiangella marina]
MRSNPMTLGLIALSLLGLSASTLANGDPVEMVRETTGELFALVEAHRDDYEQDPSTLHAELKRVLGERTDSIYSARLVLGRYGRGLDAGQVEAFADALTDVLMRRYASGLMDFQSRDQVEVLPLAGENTDRMTRVRTRIQLDNGEKAPVDYMLRKRDGQWLVFDVIVEGISYVSTFRNQFAEEIRRNGFDATLERLQRGEIDIEVGGDGQSG